MEREQFPMLNTMNTSYLKSSMNDLDRWRISFFCVENPRELIKSVSDVNIVPVSHEFIESRSWVWKDFIMNLNLIPVLSYCSWNLILLKSFFGESEQLERNIRLYGQRFCSYWNVEKKGDVWGQ
jgi:hypothetical protein